MFIIHGESLDQAIMFTCLPRFYWYILGSILGSILGKPTFLIALLAKPFFAKCSSAQGGLPALF